MAAVCDISNKRADCTLLKRRRKESSFSSLQKLRISFQIPLNGKIRDNYKINNTDEDIVTRNNRRDVREVVG